MSCPIAASTHQTHTHPQLNLAGFLDLCAAKGLLVIARPGPFVVAELKNEGLPNRLYDDHPEIVPITWDGRQTPTRTVDYLAPALLAASRDWYAAVLPVLAERLRPRGGPGIGVQLDNAPVGPEGCATRRSGLLPRSSVRSRGDDWRPRSGPWSTTFRLSLPRAGPVRGWRPG
ncbi:MAG: beta-galactosidase [Actinomycetota bacterium]|nr:beta-galactosidase [Actinomycetota bacterium]